MINIRQDCLKERKEKNSKIIDKNIYTHNKTMTKDLKETLLDTLKEVENKIVQSKIAIFLGEQKYEILVKLKEQKQFYSDLLDELFGEK